MCLRYTFPDVSWIRLFRNRFVRDSVCRRYKDGRQKRGGNRKTKFQTDLNATTTVFAFYHYYYYIKSLCCVDDISINDCLRDDAINNNQVGYKFDYQFIYNNYEIVIRI